MGKSEEEICEILSTYRIGEKKNSQPTFTIPADIDMSRYLLAGIKMLMNTHVNYLEIFILKIKWRKYLESSYIKQVLRIKKTMNVLTMK